MFCREISIHSSVFKFDYDGPCQKDLMWLKKREWTGRINRNPAQRVSFKTDIRTDKKSSKNKVKYKEKTQKYRPKRKADTRKEADKPNRNTSRDE